MTETLPATDPLERTVEARGLRFHVVDWSNAGAPPVLFLHGFSGHARTWDHAARSMRDRFHVVALDQRGHGDSDPADTYGSRLMVDDVLAVADALALERFALVGASMGGVNGYCFAAEHPERVERLVVIDIGPEVDRRGIERIMANASGESVFADADAAFERARAENPLADEAMLRNRVTRNLRATSDGRVTWKTDPAMRDFTLPREEIGRDEQWERWRSLQCPTLLLRGSESDILAADVADRMVAEQPRARLVTIDGAGHTVTMDRPVEHDAAIRDFLLDG
jgi:pimeloyl-ACP methyl ester carboxylesterase